MKKIYLLLNITLCSIITCFWSSLMLKRHLVKPQSIYQQRDCSPKEGAGWKFNTSFPVDVVYTWVNGSDPKHILALGRLQKRLTELNLLKSTSKQSIGFFRFADNGGLRYSLRSMEKYANWIRHVFIVTNGQIPEWLNLINPRVTIVTHAEIFDRSDDLPTFNSIAIEHNIHKIPGLSERFIYMNDDLCFGRNISIEDFYTEKHGVKVHLTYEKAPKRCDRGGTCKLDMLKNGVCDDVCNYDHCAWDGGDCEDNLESRPRDKENVHSTHTTGIFFTNAVFIKAFGHKERLFIAHTPLFIHKSANKDMAKRFQSEIEATIKHKVRESQDFIFPFSYAYFLAEATNSTYRVKLFKAPSPDVAYVITTVNHQRTLLDLNRLLKEKRKFICVNDGIDYADQVGATNTIAALQEFYNKMFPDPSSFEI